jgi:hypothetical protein
MAATSPPTRRHWAARRLVGLTGGGPDLFVRGITVE